MGERDLAKDGDWQQAGVLLRMSNKFWKKGWMRRRSRRRRGRGLRRRMLEARGGWGALSRVARLPTLLPVSPGVRSLSPHLLFWMIRMVMNNLCIWKGMNAIIQDLIQDAWCWCRLWWIYQTVNTRRAHKNWNLKIENLKMFLFDLQKMLKEVFGAIYGPIPWLRNSPILGGRNGFILSPGT